MQGAEGMRGGGVMQGGRDAYKGDSPGAGSGEGPSRGATAVHRVRIINHHAGQDVEVVVPEDRCGLLTSLPPVTAAVRISPRKAIRD